MSTHHSHHSGSHSHGSAPTHTDPGGTSGDGSGSGGDTEPGGFKGLLQHAGESAGEKVGEKAGDWLGEKVFGKSDEGSDSGDSGESEVVPLPGGGTTFQPGPIRMPVGTPPGGGTTYRPGPVHMPVGTPLLPGSAAYTWADQVPQEPMARLPEATHPSRGGLGGMLDEAVEYALQKSGLLDELEKATGDLGQLNAAADEWQSQARAVQNVADELRQNALPLSEQWEGGASDAFGRHMGQVVKALDSTAGGMLQTAKIINSAAQECAMAEGMIIDIISEAIEALIASLAAEAVIAVLTAGIGLIADALLSEAEIAVFVARVAKVSEELATNLEKLLTALKDLGSAVKAVKNIETAKNALTELKNVKTAVEGVREFEEGGDSLGKMGKDILHNKSFEGVGSALKDYALRQGVKKADEYATDKVGEGIKSGLGIDEDDPVETGDLSAKGLAGAAGKSAWGAAKEGLTSDTNVAAVKGELMHDVGRDDEPAPYRVDKAALASPFG